MGQGDKFLDPWESVKLGYMSKIIVNSSTPNYAIYDYASRNRSGQILQVPIRDTNEFFLITNRSKISSYDVMMYGDTAKGNPFRDVDDYGKGVYIYHVTGLFGLSGYEYSSITDEECADGLYNWTQTGYDAPEWDPSNYWLPVLEPLSVSYDNEITEVCAPNCSVNLYDTDDRNVKGLTTGSQVENKWFSPGESPSTDEIYSNATTNWTSRSHRGDRYDAWNVGNNEVFSPYSSPPTKTWSNESSGIFIWYYDNSGSGPSGLAYFKIYKAGAGEPLSEDSILHLTPPSRPMGIKVLPCDSFPSINGYKRIKLTWNHNMESDMINVNKKRYKIYCDTSLNLSTVPTDALQYPENHYRHIATVDIPTSSSPSFIDTFKISTCTNLGATYIKYPVRYRVQAIDSFNTASVLSDFTKTEAWTSTSGGQGEDNLQSENLNSPKVYSLEQNYPNPFNPITNIQYDIPIDNFVSIKIYDLLGKEVSTLINEFKQAGSYIISFNGNNLSSGIYYYKIKAGSFEQVRKMILIK